MFLYVRRLYQYLSCLERTKFRDTLRIKHIKNICLKLKRWNITHTFNLEFLIRLYCVVSNFEGYTYLPNLHQSLMERINNADNMVKILDNLDSKLVYTFIIEFSRFEIFKGNYDYVLQLLNIYKDKLNLNLDYKYKQNSKTDLINEIIKLYKENQHDSYEYQMIFDDLAIYTELAINLSRDIAKKGKFEKSFEIINELIQILKYLIPLEEKNDRLICVMRDCSLYSLGILLYNSIMDCTQGYNDTKDKNILEMSIIPIVEFFSTFKLDELPTSISSHIINTLVLAICKMCRDYQSIDTPLINFKELSTFIQLLEIILKNNPEYIIIGRKMADMYEFNLQFQKSIELINKYDIEVSKERLETLNHKENLISKFDTISNIPMGTPFPMIDVKPLDPIMIYNHTYNYTSDLYNKGINKSLTIDDCIWINAREIKSSGNTGHGLLINIGNDRIYGIWSTVGLCPSGFFPSNNYKIMDIYNSHLDTITIANTIDSIWRLHAIVDLTMNTNVNNDYNPQEFAKYVYNMAKLKCENLFERYVLINSVSILVNKNNCNVDMSNCKQHVLNTDEYKQPNIIHHNKFKDIITIKL